MKISCRSLRLLLSRNGVDDLSGIAAWQKTGQLAGEMAVVKSQQRTPQQENMADSRRSVRASSRLCTLPWSTKGRLHLSVASLAGLVSGQGATAGKLRGESSPERLTVVSIGGGCRDWPGSPARRLFSSFGPVEPHQPTRTRRGRSPARLAGDTNWFSRGPLTACCIPSLLVRCSSNLLFRRHAVAANSSRLRQRLTRAFQLVGDSSN